MKLRGVTYLALVLMLMTIGSINSMDKAFDDIPVESADIDQDKVLAELVKIKQGGGDSEEQPEGTIILTDKLKNLLNILKNYTRKKFEEFILKNQDGELSVAQRKEIEQYAGSFKKEEDIIDNEQEAFDDSSLGLRGGQKKTGFGVKWSNFWNSLKQKAGRAWSSIKGKAVGGKDKLKQRYDTYKQMDGKRKSKLALVGGLGGAATVGLGYLAGTSKGRGNVKSAYKWFKRLKK